MVHSLLLLLLGTGPGGDTLVRLVDGSVLRGALEAVEGGCRLRTASGERFVPDADVVWTARETDLLREARKLVEGAGAGREGATRHAQAALWCADAGLEEEGYRMLDRAVALDASAPAITRGVRRLADRMAAAADASERPAEEILRTVSANGARRLVAEEAIALLDPAETGPALLRALASPRTPTRRFASAVLGQRFPGQGTERLAAVAVVDTDEAVRENAVGALRRAGGERACAALAPHLASAPTAAHRRRVVGALERIGSPAAVPPLAAALRRAQTAGASGSGARGYVFFGNQISYVRDFDVEVAQAAVIADPVVGVLQEGTVLDARVLSTRSEQVVILQALRSLAGADLGESPEAWESWYRTRAR